MIGYDVTRPCRGPRFRSLSPVFRIDTKRDFVKDNKREQILFRKPEVHVRRVPAFTIQTEQKNTRPFALIPKNDPNFLATTILDEDSKRFITSYEDRQLPVRVIDQGKSRGIEWQIDPNTLKLNEARELLKIFASGLFIEKQPYNFIAVCGFQDLLKTNFGPQILAQTLVDIIPFVRKGLDSKSISKRTEMLSLIQQMASNGCGPLLVPFYRMLLPPLRKTSSRNRTSISTDISTTEWDRYLHAVDKTLSMLEESGGPNAYINIKYIIPCYYPTR
uniref:Uncharacterized protein n=2 Tax=Acrobeloides nanus TaxID=290746 RepID=A0A914E0G6_9BILA